MFKNTYQNGLLTIFYSCGSNPLAIWDMEVQNGHIKWLTDSEVKSVVLEIVSTNVATTYITCPKRNQVLGIRLPFLVMIVKNMKRYFSFEITIIDDKNMRRRFRISNFQSTTKIKPFCTSMPIGLSGGWNQIQFNLADFTKRAYGSQYLEALRVQVHANVRLRRIYFSERLYTEEELPQDYKLYLPLDHKQKKVKPQKKEAPAPVPSDPKEPAPAAPPVEPVQEAPVEVVAKASIATVTSASTEAGDAGQETEQQQGSEASTETEPIKTELKEKDDENPLPEEPPSEEPPSEEIMVDEAPAEAQLEEQEIAEE